MAKIICPNRQYTGVSGGVQFAGGIGETDNKRLIAWFKRKGYIVGEIPANDPPENLEDMNIKQLQAFAAEKEIDVSVLKKKPEIIEKIRAALAEMEGEGGAGEDLSDDEDDGPDGETGDSEDEGGEDG